MGAVLFLINLLSGCSWKTLYRLSDILAYLLFNVVGYRRAVIDVNLRNSFPEKSVEELEAIRKRFYRHFTDLIVETIKLSSCSKEDVMERMKISDEDIQLIREIKTGSVFVLGHRGNWELANLFISGLGIIEPVVVYRPLASQKFEEWFKKVRTRFGSTMTPMKMIYEELEQPRERPYAVFLVNDQSPNPKRAYWTRFLHQDTGVFRGAEVISRKCDIPVFFADIRPLENQRGYYGVKLKKFTDHPDVWPENAILEAQIREMEEYIRSQPFNWLWTHKRWKHARPETLTEEQLLQTSNG